MLWSLPRPVVFAHRGCSARAPENTLSAFALAAAEGADAVELDAKLTRDGEVVVIHDPTLERTTNGTGRVDQHPLSALRELDAGSRFSDGFRGERIPLLSEVFEAFGKKLFINVELTNYATPHDSLVTRVCELVKKHALQRRILLSSFVAGNLMQAARLLPDVPRGLLAKKGWPGLWARSFGFTLGDYAALHPHVSDISLRQVQRVQRLKRRVHVRTINAVEELRRLLAWGVDGIFTDDPRLALETIGRRA
jgi:glycerophosphoryl diester phosphodiesterase